MASKTMTIRNLDDVERFLNDLLSRTKDDVDQKLLAKCSAVVNAEAMIEGDIQDARRWKKRRIEENLDRVRSQYGE
jgi:hypothetical protein